MVTVETSQWYETLDAEERGRCADEMTDAYLQSLVSGEWAAFRAAAAEWMDRAAHKEPLTV